jgi:hypothetical protein
LAKKPDASLPVAACQGFFVSGDVLPLQGMNDNSLQFYMEQFTTM